MNSDERFLLEAIAENPDNADNLLVYADWLEEKAGDVRGAFIRLEVEYRRAGTSEERRRELEKEKLLYFKRGEVVPLVANCVDSTNDDELELILAELGVPLRKPDPSVSPRLAGFTCRPFDFTNALGIRLNMIPAGTFMMGVEVNLSDLSEGIHPFNHVQQVRISQPFHIGVWPVTQFQYSTLMKVNPSYFVGPDGAEEVRDMDTSMFPVDRIDWFMAKRCCEVLSESEGWGEYILPTEAQWEHACRAGASTKYFFGDDQQDLERYANYQDCAPNRTELCGSRIPNQWGLYDTHGNVCEWTQTWSSGLREAQASNEVQVDPQGPSQGQVRKNKGGSWDSRPRGCQAGRYRGDHPSRNYNYYGFRVACVIDSWMV